MGGFFHIGGNCYISFWLVFSEDLFAKFYSLIVWIVSLFITFKFCSDFSSALSFIPNPSLKVAVAFAILFIVTLVLGDLISCLIAKAINFGGFNIVDRILGIFFGFIRGIILVSVVLLLISVTLGNHELWWRESCLIPHFKIILNWFKDYLPHELNLHSISFGK